MSMGVGTMEHGQLTILVTRYHECALVLLDYNLELLSPTLHRGIMVIMR